ncbi:ClpXP adapter SpxH family protein [Peribacillus butanolivorans]|uniref:ClpXP adapter SpxH family protein n=1 Tax=unclassified Peribacillus TaxID=2675266 RepID=UPI0006F8AF45|nr:MULTISPECIES: ClpXP adapter SpxH family protein [unclassified Peribacillus]KQU17296.1 dithiol-disulfide isomerase [Bacillus sp. Leaf13]KRF62716.1 dithiol-disulfide isomerase [Bacillus sp. Soil768D1]WMX58281.1 ClpXP adapter SpxH family protein [Peribacillus sp. R9-11]
MSDWIKTQHCYDIGKKPIEIYVFVDPLCPECWGLEPIIRKLQIEYGQLFSLRHVLSGKIDSLNMGKNKNYENLAQVWEKTASRSGMSCDGSLWLENPISSPYSASIAIKAAELQGRKLAIRFLRQLQEHVFIGKRDISNIEVLTDCAKTVGLDVEEFLHDINSSSAAKGFQCDLKITSEMEVTEIPSLVFFNQNIEEEGIKVSGVYSYEVYVQILEDMLNGLPAPAEPPSLEEFLSCFKLVATKEIETVYNMNKNNVELEMKKLVLKQVAEKIPAKYGTFWRYTEKQSLE